jgi:hypothetical protein
LLLRNTSSSQPVLDFLIFEDLSLTRVETLMLVHNSNVDNAYVQPAKH